MLLSGLKRFLNGTKANANEVNQNFDSIVNTINGNLGSENLADGSITKQKLSFALASDKFLGSVVNFGDLATTFTSPRHCDTAIVESEVAQYMYDLPSLKWVKTSGSVATVSHNTLDGRESTDAHPMGSITGLESRLSSIEGDVTSLEGADTTLNGLISGHESRIDTAEADISAINTKNTSQDTAIAGKYDKTGGELTGDVTVKKGAPAVNFDSGNTRKPKIYHSATMVDDNGFFIDSGATSLKFNNIIPALSFSRDKSIWYELLDKANFQSFWDSVKVLDELKKPGTTQAISSAVYTRVDFGTGQPTNWNSTNKEWTCPKAGKYRIFGNVTITNMIATSAANKQAYLRFLINGAGGSDGQGEEGSSTMTFGSVASVQAERILTLSAGDKIALSLYVDGGGNVSHSWSNAIFEYQGN